MADDDRIEPTDDDALVAELLEGLERWGSDPDADAAGRPSGPVADANLCAVLLDVGNLSDGAPTLVRAVAPVGDGLELFEHERERLEIPREDVTGRPVPWDTFHRAGGSAALLVAPYRRRERSDGSVHLRCLVLMVARLST